jgi:hypothetical protein
MRLKELGGGIIITGETGSSEKGQPFSRPLQMGSEEQLLFSPQGLGILFVWEEECIQGFGEESQKERDH